MTMMSLLSAAETNNNNNLERGNKNHEKYNEKTIAGLLVMALVLGVAQPSQAAAPKLKREKKLDEGRKARPIKTYTTRSRKTIYVYRY